MESEKWKIIIKKCESIPFLFKGSYRLISNIFKLYCKLEFIDLLAFTTKKNVKLYSTFLKLRLNKTWSNCSKS